MIENTNWQLGQVQMEYERTYRLSLLALVESTPARLSAALRRYEVFVSRIPLILRGDGMEKIGRYPDLVVKLQEIEAAFADIDRALAGASDNRKKVDLLARELSAYEPLMIEYGTVSKRASSAEDDDHTAIEHELNLRMQILFYGVVAVVFVFAIVTWRQLRGVENSRQRLESLARRLADESARAEAANRAKTDFLANMSHELRTPLNAIIGFAEMINEEILGRVNPPAYRDYGHTILKSGQYMLALVGDLLDIAKIEAGALRLNPEWTDLRDECTRAIESAGADAKTREKNVTFDAAGLPHDLFVHADRRALRHMLAAVLSNAVRFNRQGGSCLLTAGEEEGWFRLSFTDTGKGMSPTLVERLLDPFTHTAGKTIEGMQETGFGLSLVRRYMELHGGKIRIASIEHGGTTISLLFPIASMQRAGTAHVA